MAATASLLEKLYKIRHFVLKHKETKYTVDHAYNIITVMALAVQKKQKHFAALRPVTSTEYRLCTLQGCTLS